MPKVSGEPAQYVRQEAANKRRKIVMYAFWAIGIMSAIAGFLLRSSLQRISIPPLVSVTVTTACLGASWLVSKRATDRITQTHRERLHMESGARGETAVAHELQKLPTEYHVLND